jgi:hypothetical protein
MRCARMWDISSLIRLNPWNYPLFRFVPFEAERSVVSPNPSDLVVQSELCLSRPVATESSHNRIGTLSPGGRQRACRVANAVMMARQHLGAQEMSVILW